MPKCKPASVETIAACTVDDSHDTWTAKTGLANWRRSGEANQAVLVLDMLLARGNCDVVESTLRVKHATYAANITPRGIERDTFLSIESMP